MDLPFKLHLQSLAIEALAVAHIARHIHIRQELHFNAQLACPWQASQRPPLTLKENRPVV